MTVSYTGQVATCKTFGCFWKLLFRWKGSIYKLLWPSLIVYILLYGTLSSVYRFMLSDSQKTTFEKVSLHCQQYADLIPVSFVLGFYVSIVVKRWWDQYTCIPWPDPLAIFVSALVTGEDERGRLIRRTIMRYANLSLLLTLRMVCPTVKKRFPSYEHVVEAGFMLPHEKKLLDIFEEKTPHPKYWMPCVWAIALITRARKENRIKDDFSVKTLIDETNKFRSECGALLSYDWISVPLVYTQVVTLAVYTYFGATLMGNQFLSTAKGYPKHAIDLVVPIFTLLQFFFYMGWLLVAETLVNPFGEDDDDFEANWLIDRNLQVSYLIVDEMHDEHPELYKDQYWEEVFPSVLPYTESSRQYHTEPFLGSTKDVPVQPNSPFIPVSLRSEAKAISQRGETTPMVIRSRILKADGETPSNLSSYAAGPFIIGSSATTLMKKSLFREENRKSSTSLASCFVRKIASRNGPRLSSSSVSKYDNYTIDEMYPQQVFHMSDVSLLNSENRKCSSTSINIKIEDEIIVRENTVSVQTVVPEPVAKVHIDQAIDKSPSIELFTNLIEAPRSSLKNADFASTKRAGYLGKETLPKTQENGITKLSFPTKRLRKFKESISKSEITEPSEETAFPNTSEPLTSCTPEQSAIVVPQLFEPEVSFKCFPYQKPIIVTVNPPNDKEAGKDDKTFSRGFFNASGIIPSVQASVKAKTWFVAKTGEYFEKAASVERVKCNAHLELKEALNLIPKKDSEELEELPADSTKIQKTDFNLDISLSPTILEEELKAQNKLLSPDAPPSEIQFVIEQADSTPALGKFPTSPAIPIPGVSSTHLDEDEDEEQPSLPEGDSYTKHTFHKLDTIIEEDESLSFNGMQKSASGIDKSQKSVTGEADTSLSAIPPAETNSDVMTAASVY